MHYDWLDGCLLGRVIKPNAAPRGENDLLTDSTLTYVYSGVRATKHGDDVVAKHEFLPAFDRLALVVQLMSEDSDAPVHDCDDLSTENGLSARAVAGG